MSAATLRPWRRRAELLLAATLVVGAVGVVLPAAPSASAAAGSPSRVTVEGRGAFSSVRVTVDQTEDLVNQTVRVSWTGAGASVAPAGGTVLGNFMQLMQCWAEPGQQPTREQCQFGGFTAVPSGAGNVASRQITQYFVDPKETTYVNPPGDLRLRFVDFKGVDGTVDKDGQSQFFDASTTNELPVARTAADGTGSQFFEMQTGLEAPGLGCGQTIAGRSPDCFLVVVPRDLTEVTGATVGSRIDDWLYSSPLSQSNWDDRIVVPLQFRTVGGACSFGRPETPTSGSDFVTEAITSWQPVLCEGGDRNFGFTSLSDDSAREVLGSSDPGLVFLTRSAPNVSGAVYAPVSVSAMAIAANIDVQLPSRGPDGKPVAPDAVPADIAAKVGSRFESINLTPRLLAKLLTQSYRFDVAFGSGSNVADNPFDMSRDPEFLEINPDFKPRGYRMTIPNSVGRILVAAGLSDSAELVWRYVLSDADARAFLAGKPDPWGMVLNAKYKGLSLPTNSFPRSDLGCKLPVTAPAGFDLENCTLDVFPYANSFGSAARQLSRGDANRRDVPKLSQINSYGLSPNQQFGERSLIAITDTSSVARYDQVAVALRNKAGKFVLPTTASMAAAVASMTKDSAGLLTPNVAPSDPKAYPLTVVTYGATVPSKLTANQRADYARLLRYAAGDGQQEGTRAGDLPEGYLPLTASLRSQATKAATAIAAYVAPTATPTPTPTPSGTTGTADGSSGGSTGDGTGSTGDGSGTAGQPQPQPSASPSAPVVPTASPSTNPVALVVPTPADPASASRLALAAALVLGAVALLARVALPWVASRSG